MNGYPGWSGGFLAKWGTAGASPVRSWEDPACLATLMGTRGKAGGEPRMGTWSSTGQSKSEKVPREKCLEKVLLSLGSTRP